MSKQPGTRARDLADVERRLRDLRGRRDVRWTMSHETAELAIAALRDAEADRAAARPAAGGKSRRRKRSKRLL